MKAAVCKEFGRPLVVEDVHLRSIRENEVKVKIMACAICHSDISCMEGAWGGDLPAVYGHEASGVVLEVGIDVLDCKLGDHVLVTLIRACGDCISCGNESFVTCEEPYHRLEQSPLINSAGHPIEHGLGTAAFAEEAIIHHSQIHKIPSSLPFDVASLLSCGVITGFGAVRNTANIEAGCSVAVIGVGGVGLNAIQGAKICGADRIVAVDLSHERLKQAQELGATDLIVASDTTHRAIRQLTEGRGVNYAFVTAGVGEIYNSAIKCLAPKGELIAVGMPPSDFKGEWSPVNLAYLGQSIKGSKMGDTVLKKDIPYLLELYKNAELKLDQLISHRYKLEDINRAIDEVRHGAVARNVICFD